VSLELGHFTTPPNPPADRLIAAHMARIRDAILECGAGNIACIALTGGFGRGEGGVTSAADETYRPVNDYDLLIVTRRDGLVPRLALRRCIKRREPALSAELGIRVDIAVKTPRMLRGWPATVEAHEVAAAYQLLWGDAAALDEIRWRSPASLPASEASRYLFNRGAALLWARRLLAAPAPLDEERWQFVVIATEKAQLAWGDALLLLAGRYVARYGERHARLLELSLPAELAFVADVYRDALRFKLEPAFEPFRHVDLAAWLVATIQSHERVWRWVETQRSWDQPAPAGLPGPAAFWLDYYARPGPRLSMPTHHAGLRASLYALALNLWRVRPRAWRGWLEHPEERLVRILPLLLFVEDAGILPLAQMAAQLGCGVPAGAWRERLSDRFIAIWHPGIPFAGRPNS